jgi:chromate transporter
MSSRSNLLPILHPTFREAFRFWLKLGFISFGGPAGQIAIMHTELVERRRWISESRFLHALNFCMLLPGPEAQQLAIYSGWLLHGTWGGIVAGGLFVLPSAVILWALSCVYMTWGHLGFIAGAFLGLKPAVLAIVTAAALRIGRKALKNQVMWGIAALAFIAMFVAHIPFPIVIGAAALIGWIGGNWMPERFQTVTGHGQPEESLTENHRLADLHRDKGWGRVAKVLSVGLALWWTPILATGAIFGWGHTLTREGLFFSKAAMVTFGGAYAVLPYVAQQAVEKYQWLTAPQMLDGLGLAETTPGPLIMVLQFVGFAGGWQHGAPLSPLAGGTLGAALTTWATFVPCFLWIFLGAPYIEGLRSNLRLNAALSAVTAAVVGVILNLAVWFGWHVLFPAGHAVNWFGVLVTVVAFAGLVRWKWDIVPTVLLSASAGLLWRLTAG